MISASFVVIWGTKYQMSYWQKPFVNTQASKKLKSFAKLELINQRAMDLFPLNTRMISFVPVVKWMESMLETGQ
uniref:BMA-TAG-262, isoform a n=1 Tax=Brugia malayi TaxID=6279 RepID=A0A1I9G4W2_BRUMA|nr:BMA-TAG-262, isoform a [Brugia malayi]